MVWCNCFETIYYIFWEVKKMFEKKLEKFLEHIAVKHATSASCYMFFEPKMPKILVQMIKKEK